METNAERRRRKLADLCQERGLSNVAMRSGLNPASLDQIIKGVLLPPKRDGTRSPRALGDEAARRIEDGEGLGRGWFDSESELVDLDPVTRNKATHDDSLYIPQYATGGSMGGGVVLRDQPGAIRSWVVSPEWVAKNVHNITSAKNLAIVTGFGDSMRPLYNPGDPLLIDTGVKSVEFDAIYFFRVGDEGFVKRLQRIPGRGLLAISENQSYRDWTIEPSMDFEVFGRVIKVWRGEDF